MLAYNFNTYIEKLHLTQENMYIFIYTYIRNQIRKLPILIYYRSQGSQQFIAK